MEMETARLHAIVEGYVQGVGFRYFVQDSALAFGLTGWVRNRWEGTVEVLAEGERSTLEKFLTTLYRGPSSATVTGVDPEWSPATGEFRSFSVRLTVG